MLQAEKLTSLQLELLKTYSFQPNEEDLLAIRAFLANYFSQKLISKVRQSVEENQITEEDLEKWINE